MLFAFIKTAPGAHTFVVLSLVVVAGWGCGGGGEDGGGGTTNPPPAGGFTIAASTSNISIAQSATHAVTVNVSRTGSFTTPVNQAASRLPTRVTGTLSP